MGKESEKINMGDLVNFLHFTYKGLDLILERSNTQSLILVYKSTGWIFRDLKPNISDTQLVLERKEPGSVWM